MAIFKGATWKPLPENETQSAIVPTQVILHTAVDQPGPTDLPRYFARADVTLESHFWVPLDGKAVQMVDTEVRADANRRANLRPDGTGAISIETEDEGDPVGVPWTAEQLGTIKAIIRWAHVTHGIPMTICHSPSAPGLGYHSMWGAPSDWTPSAGKTCPGPTRIIQFHGIVKDLQLNPGALKMTNAEAEAVVRIAYQAFLGRAPEAAALPGWIDYIVANGREAFLWAFMGAAGAELGKTQARLAALEAAVANPAIPAGVVDIDAILKAISAKLA